MTTWSSLIFFNQFIEIRPEGNWTISMFLPGHVIMNTYDNDDTTKKIVKNDEEDAAEDEELDVKVRKWFIL